MATPPKAMSVLTQHDKDAAMHIHFMKLAIEQANLSIPVPSGYCVGAVLVQETEQEDEGYADRFRVVVTGYSRELPGNTHAEECCLLKLATLGADTGSRDDVLYDSESDGQEQEEQEREQYVRFGGRAKDQDLGSQAAPAPSAGAVAGTGVSIAARQCFSSETGASFDNTSNPNKTNSSNARTLKPKSRRKWIMYSTMEPCSTRLSGNRSCSDRLIASGIRRVYVGVREPDHFVKTVVGVENMVEKGIEVIHIPGLEEECLAPNRHEEETEVHFEPIVKLEAVQVKTHEEEEDSIFKMRAKLFRFVKESNEWKERGTGDVRLMQHKETKKIRLLMRRDQTLKICANHYVTSEMTLTPNVGSDRSWVWNVTADNSDECTGPQTLAIRLANPENAAKFKEAFEDAQKNNADLKAAAAPAAAEEEKKEEAKEEKKDEKKDEEKKEDAEEKKEEKKEESA
ncbi:hypothetical protein BGX29_000972 [Mortierella sp. GBA35]|nr:hypothetical protein BGX29_000972 [Mortierella sp. GBA35]